MLEVTYRFRLYVAGESTNSAQAISNLKCICDRHLPDRHHIEIVDVLRDPLRALADSVFLTPTLVKLAPHAEVRIVGNLSNMAPILKALGLDTA